MARDLSVEILRAVAHPLRLAILCRLEADGDLTTAELADRLGVAPERVRRQLRALGAAGLVRETPLAGRHRVVDAGWSEVARRLRGLAGGHDALSGPGPGPAA